MKFGVDLGTNISYPKTMGVAIWSDSILFETSLSAANGEF